MAKELIRKRTCPVCKYEYQAREFYQSKFERNGGTKYDDWWLPDMNYYEEVLSDVTVIKGDVDFKMLENPSDALIREGDSHAKENYLGMFCPKCGVFLDIDICTKIKE